MLASVPGPTAEMNSYCLGNKVQLIFCALWPLFCSKASGWCDLEVFWEGRIGSSWKGEDFESSIFLLRSKDPIDPDSLSFMHVHI